MPRASKIKDSSKKPMPLPTGTVTFLFTDIEGSTQRWEAHRAAMAQAIVRHDTLVRAGVEKHGGFVFKTIGDAFCAAFSQDWLAKPLRDHLGDERLQTLMAECASWSEERGYEEALSAC